MTTPGRRGRRAMHKAGSATLGALPSTVLSDSAPLIGRESELEAIRTHLIGESVRLVTLTGPGGIGKTRLALAAARYVQPAFRDGVWFIDLAPLHDPAEIDVAIGQVLRLEEAAAALPPAEQVTAYLRDRHLLLVLDNFEHLLPAAARVAALLAAAPQLKVLVTSREALKLRLEHRVSLAGLALPDLRTPDLAAVALAPAAALFVEHARRIQPDFGLTPTDARALAALLHRLDGLPLAIRIAAVHSHALSVEAMLARLQGQALLAMEEAQDVPTRQHTLRDTIDWSYGLLSASEQAAFRDLSVFVGGWSLEAAEAVLQEREPAAPVWAILGRLVDKSLVQADAIASDDRRYRMLQPVREYALALLQESGGLEAARDRHARYYFALGEQAEPALLGPEEDAWYRRLEAELENIRAALRWAAERGDGEFGLRLAGALANFWGGRNYLREGRRWLEDARALGSDTSSQVRGGALDAEGLLAVLQGDYPQARALLRDALAVAEALRDPALTARVLSHLGITAALQGDAPDARALLERSLALRRELRARDVVLALVGRGRTFVMVEDLERADVAVTEGLDVARSAGSPRLTAFALAHLAQLKLRRGDYTGAAGLAAEALRVARATQSRWSIKHVVGIAALVSAHRGDVERAVCLLAAADPSSEWAGEFVSATYRDPSVGAVLHERARQQMGDAAYHAGVAEARAMSVDQVADMAQACLELSTQRDPGRTTTAGADRASPLLSDREQTVLRLVGEGLPNKQIATALSIGERTVKSSVASAMNKLGVDNRAHAAVAAIQRGLL